MKKVLAVIVILAMLIVTFTVVSHAGGYLCVDGAYLTNETDINGTHAAKGAWTPLEGEKDVASGTRSGDIGNIYGLGYSYYHLQGWWSDDAELADMGYQINDGEIVWNQLIYDEALVGNKGATGHEYPYRYFLTLPLQEGSVAIKLYKKYAAGGEEVFHTINYANVKPDGSAFTAKPVSDNDGNPGTAVWLNEAGEYAAVKFTTTDKLGGMELFYWASNGTTTGPLGSFTAELYAFDTDNDTTLSKAPAASTTLDWLGDNTPAFAWKLDEPLAAGTYIFKVTITGETATGVDGNTAYVVFPAAAGALDGTEVEYINTAVNFNFAAYGPDNVSVADYYTANPETAEGPTLANIDFVLLWNGAAFVENFGKGSNLGQLKMPYEAGGTQFYFVGWYVAPSAIENFGYQFDDGEVVYGSFNITYDETAADIIAGWGYNSNFYRGFAGLVPVETGAHTVRIICKQANGKTTVVYETSYRNDDSDIALGKPVYIDLMAIGAYAAGYWDASYLTDGYNPVHNPDVVADPVPLGWYGAYADDPMAKYYVDLQGIYDLSHIDIHAMGFDNGSIPKAFDIHVSVDGTNWERIGGVAGVEGVIDSAEPFVFETNKRARYIMMDVVEFNTTASGKVVGLGEIEAYGTFVEASTSKAPYSNYYSTYTDTVRTDDPSGLSGWNGYTTGSLEFSFEFNTDVSFYKIGFPAFWGYAYTPFKVELIKDGEVVHTLNYTVYGDGALALNFGRTFEPGQYICKFTILDDTLGSPANNYPEGAFQCYLVIGYADGGLLGSDYVAADRGQLAIDLYSTDMDGQGFIRRAYKQHVNIDAIQLDGVDQEKGDNIDILVDENSKEILVHGWLASNFPVERYGYKLDGGETVYDDSFLINDPASQDTLAIAGAAKSLMGPGGNGFRTHIIVPVLEGKHTVEVVALVDGADRHIRSFTYGVEPATPFQEFVARDQVTIDGADKAKFGDNAEVTELADNLYSDFGKQLRIWGWYANNKGLDKYGIKLDGGNIVYFDRYEAEDIVNHVKTNLIKDDDVYASRFEIMVDITEGKHTAEIFAIVNGEERLIWTVKFQCLPEEVPLTTDEPVTNENTGDAALTVIAVIAVLALSAAVVLRKKSAF